MPCGHFGRGACAPFAPTPPLVPALSKCIAGSVKRSSREYFLFSFFYDVECVTVTI